MTLTGRSFLVSAILLYGCATAHNVPLPESRCGQIRYYDFSVGTVSTYCEPRPGQITVYEHTYPNGFAIFNPNGDDRVDRYCNMHRCVERTDLESLPHDRRKVEEQFFRTWDEVLASLPETIKKGKK